MERRQLSWQRGQQGTLLNGCITVTRALGVLEPLTGEHIPPEALLIQGPNWRESLVGNGLLSRNKALLRSDLPGVPVIKARR